MAEQQPKDTKVTPLNTHYSKEEVQEFQQDQKKIIYRRRRMAAIMGVAVVILLFIGANLFKGYQDIQKLQREKKAVLAEQAQVHREVATLGQEVSLLKDEEYLQKLARAKYYYSLEGELVYSVPQTATAGADKLNGEQAGQNKQQEKHETQK